MKRSASIADALSGSLSKSTQETQSEQTVPSPEAKKQEELLRPFSQQQLNVVWKEMARKANDTPLLISTINKRLPLLQHGYVVEYGVENAEEKKVIEGVADRVIKYLQHRLQNNKISLELVFVKESPQPTQHTPTNNKANQQEALNKLLEQNPDISDLLNRFNLDLD